LLDFEMADGRRILVGGAYLATDETGDHLAIVSEEGIPYALEDRRNGHYVTGDGIEE
jgi:hypothetical protein